MWERYQVCRSRIHVNARMLSDQALCRASNVTLAMPPPRVEFVWHRVAREFQGLEVTSCPTSCGHRRLTARRCGPGWMPPCGGGCPVPSSPPPNSESSTCTRAQAAVTLAARASLPMSRTTTLRGIPYAGVLSARRLYGRWSSDMNSLRVFYSSISVRTIRELTP